MCGIAGFIGLPGSSRYLEAIIGHMTRTLEHRGPDQFGIWSSTDSAVALGHCRLSVLDLSPAGNQPMHSQNRRFVIVFNGEIYNHAEMRSKLGNSANVPQWRGHSDTETLLAALGNWGIEATLKRTVGMFAMAVWDRQDRTLYLARDRMGEKPLYYGWLGHTFAFASELKALKAHPDFANQVCRKALAQYLRFMYVPMPRSIYQGIYKLEPGCLLTIREKPPLNPPADPLRPPMKYGSLEIARWWSVFDVVAEGAKSVITDETAALDELETLLTEAVSLQMLADVPLGAFLSGGVDSSTIVSLMQMHSAGPVKTYTVGFDEAEFDESRYAKAVARHLRTDHTELFVTAEEARSVIPLLPAMYDEPFADSSQIPTHLVCKAAKSGVTVALSGDGGDELFGGYNRYFWSPRIWNKIGWMPFAMRRGFGFAIEMTPKTIWNNLSALVNLISPDSKGVSQLENKILKLATRLKSVTGPDDLYLSLVSEWPQPSNLIQSTRGSDLEPKSLIHDPLPAMGVDNDSFRMMYRDSMTYLPDDILCKVDRAAMSISLETRVPFLDHRVVEFAWRLPLSMKIRNNQGKWALRQILYRHVPKELIERPKSGFAIPIGKWMRGPLRSWAEDLLDKERLKREGYLRPEPIEQAWKEHISGERDWTYRIWAVLMFQSWLEAK